MTEQEKLIEDERALECTKKEIQNLKDLFKQKGYMFT